MGFSRIVFSWFTPLEAAVQTFFCPAFSVGSDDTDSAIAFR